MRALLLLIVASLFVASGCVHREPPGGDFRKVSELVRFPDFYPGLGTLYVQPATLPVGPFQAYDRSGNLVSTIYMLPIRDIEAQRAFDDLPAPRARVNHVDVHYTSGHPGVDEPHYHVIVWHVSPRRASELE